MTKRITPYSVKSLEENEVFVFGSNKSGIHGKGAARKALDHFGAQWNKPEGLYGNSYAIPTKDFNVKDTLDLQDIRMHVDLFIELARSRPDLTFYVTEIGCGYAGYEPNDIAPLFVEAVELKNIYLPERFWDVLKGMGYDIS